MRKFAFISMAAALALMGAGCSLTPLKTTEQPRGFADVKVTDKPTTQVTTNPTESTESAQPTEETTKPVETTPTETTKPEETPAPAPTTNGYGGKVIGTVTLKADAAGVVVFLVAEKSEYKGTDAYMEFGCESLLVPIKRDFVKTQSDLAEAIVQLITIKQNAYADIGLRNAVAPSAPTIRLTGIHYEGKTRIIDFEGSFVSSGVCEDPRIKAQIEETIKLYSDNYEIHLNGTAANWKCLFNQSGTCE